MRRLSRLSAMKFRVKGIRLFRLFSDKRVFVYNGCKLIEVFVRPEMVGSFLGSYVFTKVGTSAIHSKTKRNKRGRMKKKKK